MARFLKTRKSSVIPSLMLCGLAIGFSNDAFGKSPSRKNTMTKSLNSSESLRKPIDFHDSEITSMQSDSTVSNAIVIDPLEFRVLSDKPSYQLENELVHAFQRDSKNSKYPYLLSLLYQKMQVEDKEERDYYLGRAAVLARQSYELDKKAVYGYVSLANLLFLASQREKALNLIQKIRPTTKESELWMVDYHEAAFLEEMDRPEEALVKIANLFEHRNAQISALATDLCQSICLRIDVSVLMPLLKQWHDQTKSVKLSAMIAKNLIRSGQKAKARQVLSQAVAENPASIDAGIELAENYLNESPSSPDRALELVKKQLKHLNPEDAEKSGKHPSTFAKKSVEKKAPSAISLLSFEGNAAEEITLLVHADKISDKQRASLLKILGYAWLQKDSLKAAETAFLSYISMNQTKFAAKELVDLYIEHNRSKAGLSFIDKFIEIAPGDASLYALRGELGQQDKRTLDAAAEDYINAITLRPEDTKFYNSLGLIYFKMNRLEHAIAVFEKSVSLNPKDPDAFYHLACAQALSGKDELAINALEKAIAMSPELSLSAVRNKDFDSFKSSSRFQTLIESAISH